MIGVSSPAREASASSPAVSVYPIPGSRLAAPRTQITFRGIPARALGTIAVTGSRSGPHAGIIEADSDGRGGSFLPATPFAGGETVTVTTSLNVLGGAHGSFHFRIATLAGPVRSQHWPPAPRAAGDVDRFRSRPDLAPPAVSIARRSSRTAAGDVFLAPQFGPVQDGPMIVDPNGNLVWFDRLSGNDSAADLRVQTLLGRPVLTWWQGYVAAGIGVGEDVIADTSYRQLAIVHAANGVASDLHEFELTAHGTALVTAELPVIWDTRAVHGSSHQIVFDSIVQEIDIPTGLVLFQWDSLDHVPVTDSYATLPAHLSQPFDYFHVNSIDPDDDGNLVISARNTWAAYKISPATGAIMWRLGGRHSSFSLAPGVYWAFQHDVRVRANNDQFVTLFDDSAGPPRVHPQSRGIKLLLDLRHMTVRLAGTYAHAPPISSNFEGNVQQLRNGDEFLGWGQRAYFTEFDSRGRLIFDGHFVGPNSSYRAYRFPWSAQPATPPAVAATTKGRTTTVYVSWNGATDVAAWRVLGGATPTSLRPIATARKQGFETAIRVPAQRYLSVDAVGASGRVLQPSPTVQPATPH